MSIGWGIYRSLWAADRGMKWARIAEQDEKRENQRRRKGDVQFGRREADLPTQLRPRHNSYANLIAGMFLAAFIWWLSSGLGAVLHQYGVLPLHH